VLLSVLVVLELLPARQLNAHPTQATNARHAAAVVSCFHGIVRRLTGAAASSIKSSSTNPKI
jgi:hypothetical protein